MLLFAFCYFLFAYCRDVTVCQLAIGESSFAATECLTAAMQASQAAGEVVTPQVMAMGQAFEKDANVPETEEEMLKAARSALPALEQVLGHFSK